MVSRILDPDRFMLAGAVIDWAIAARRQGKDITDLVAQRGIGPAVVQLRWILDPKLGLPTQAFQVWQRNHADAGTTLATAAKSPELCRLPGPAHLQLGRAVGLRTRHRNQQRRDHEHDRCRLFGAPDSLIMVGLIALGAGSQTFSFSGNKITCIAVWNGTASNIEGFDGNNAANDPAWKLVEHVGLPVDQNDWSSVFGWDDKQGWSMR